MGLLAHWQRTLLLTMPLAGATRIAHINPTHVTVPRKSNARRH